MSSHLKFNKGMIEKVSITEFSLAGDILLNKYSVIDQNKSRKI